MKKFKNSAFYVIIIAVFSFLIYWALKNGKTLEAGRTIKESALGTGQWDTFVKSIFHNLGDPLALLLVQIITIIFVARFFGWICRKIGQPSVIGEMIAGIVLGPSLVGTYFPEYSALLFPSESLGNLKYFSQLGLILFMFVVGMELDLSVLKNKAKDAVIISHASIIIPFTLGLTLAYFIYDQFAPADVAFSSFGLFMGIAMSITAFPVLARIVQERGLHRTRIGAMVITCAAADDVTAWCILAAVIAIVKAGSFVSALYIIGLSVVYVFLMLWVVKPFLKRIGDLYSHKENVSKPVVAIFFLTLLISSYTTEIIGIHALFGAFMAGAIMPENMRFRAIFIEKVEDVSQVILLPLFFVFTGLKTQIGLLNDPYMWKVCGLIILVAVVGKFLGSALTAKFVGQNWRDSLTIGALMNTRGLMELIVLNIGLELGVLSVEIFSMMVIMALATTFMTGPALDLIGFIYNRKKNYIPAEIRQASNFKVLVSFSSPEEGKTLLRLANAFVCKMKGNAMVTAMHVSVSNEIHTFNLDEYEKESFKPVLAEAENLDQRITTLFKASTDPDSDIATVANKGEFDLVLIDIGQSIFEGTLLGKILGFTTRMINPENLLNTFTGKEKLFENSPFDEQTQHILTKTDSPVGILVDKQFKGTDRVFVTIFQEDDAFLIDFAQKLISNAGSQVTVLDADGSVKNNPQIKETIRSIEHNVPNHIQLINEKKLEKEFLQSQDLMIISVDSWKKLVESRSTWLNNTPSLLLIKK
ncbi:transporter [Flavobacterium akiainvivens]|uniref:Transporter n=1 Tax=Flavobacterium akiainvivens TaxID=1202724 RepID=A0A0M8M8F4_9FLAO|nr:cation:proton antiporter [Flavobacterium akiainvivens]KOS05683.1 transporter [Flavobacterium akiainvivens]SFQ36618.1 transporter, CPA2 family [Flavobacterium akiainvivens]